MTAVLGPIELTMSVIAISRQLTIAPKRVNSGVDGYQRVYGD